MTMKEPPIATDMTQPVQGPQNALPLAGGGTRNLAVIGVMLGFALVAVVMLGIGFVAGRATSNDDTSRADVLVVEPPNGDDVRLTEAASYSTLVAENALLSQQVAVSQRNFATADARLRTLAPILETAAPTLNALANTSPAAADATPDAPIVTLAPNVNTPLQGLLPGETNIAAPDGPYRFAVEVSAFTVADTLPNCGRIEGTILPATNTNEDFRVEWRHTARPEAASIVTRGGAEGPGRFSLAVPTDLASGVFLIQVFNSENVAVSPVVTIRFPAECTGYRLSLAYTEGLG